MSGGWRQYMALQKTRKRAESGKFMVEGVRLCMEAIRSGWPVEVAFITPRFHQSHHWPNLEDTFLQRKIPWRELAEANFNRLADTDSPQGIILIMQKNPEQSLRPAYRSGGMVLFLDDIKDPGNMGTLIRTADWFGVRSIILSPECVDVYNAKVLRSTMGSIFSMKIFPDVPLEEEIARIKENRFMVVAASLAGKTPLHKAKFRNRTALILGGEAHGVSPSIEKLADISLKVWNYGQSESLNVAVAGGIFMDRIAEATNKAS